MPTDRIRQAIEQISAKPDPVRLAKIADLASRAADAAEMKRAPLDPIMDELEALTGFREGPRYWASFHGGGGPEEFALTIGVALPEPISDLEPAEIRALLALETRGRETGNWDEAENQRVLEYLSACLGDAFTTDVIYNYFVDLDLDGLTQEVVHRRNVLAEGGKAALDAYEVEASRRVLNAGTSLYAHLLQALRRLPPAEREQYKDMLEAKFEREVKEAYAQRLNRTDAAD
jgi:hypothetical protein